MSREFFDAVKEKISRTNITELTNPEGDSTTNQLDIERTCLAFYRELYSAQGQDDSTRHSEGKMLESIPARVTSLMALALAQPLSEHELHAATCALAKEKALGPDKIAVNFFTVFWPQIGEDFCKMIRNAVSSESFLSGVTRGLITLIPKSGDLKLLNN